MCLSACDDDICEDMHGVGGGWMVMATCMFIPYQIDFFLAEPEIIYNVYKVFILIIRQA